MSGVRQIVVRMIRDIKVGRLRAKWRQVDVENREAIKVRRQWMALIGCDDAEIGEACDNAYELSLEDELEQLGAAIRLAR